MRPTPLGGEAPALAWETWQSFWPEAEVLVLEQFAEQRKWLKQPYDCHLDVERLQALMLAGHLAIAGARLRGALVGYCSWTIDVNLEAVGQTVIRQGAFYVRTEAARWRLGEALLRWSLEAFRGLDKPLELVVHSPVHGRGKALERLFARKGFHATRIEHTLYLGGPLA